MTKIARHAKAALELIHAMIYFAPEGEERYTALGLKKGRMGYYASRSAAMGPVGPGVVAATFYNFNPESVAEHIPAAWEIASPSRVLDARLDAADAALRRMLGDEIASSPDIARAADLAREAAEGCTPEGKPLYAAHADLAWPEPPHLRLWHAVTLLREFRGDAHIAALQHAGISGIQSLVLHSTLPGGFKPEAARLLREWSDQQWSQAADQLRERDLVDADDHITEEGEKLREEVEVATDAMSVAPWQRLDQEQLQELISGGGAVSKALYKAGAVPSDLFA
ncbi:SCO6745 family protein [Saccharopolyspora griseoalba]|uniref:SalK n=1 Tax=Saccharopolyspora griseoalba TaxID=1431848 RepID=A0ABW2LM41_9PSEU